jgi:hypothetical protein
MKKIVFIILIVGVLMGGAIAYYITFLRPKRDIAGEKPAYTLTTDELGKTFELNLSETHTKFDDKVIQLMGVVEQTETDAAGNPNLFFHFEGDSLEASIQFTFLDKFKQDALLLKQGDKVVVKGNYTGFIKQEADDSSLDDFFDEEPTTDEDNIDNKLRIIDIKFNNGYLVNPKPRIK